MIYLLSHAVGLAALLVLLYLPVPLFEALLGRTITTDSYPHLSRMVLGMLFWIAAVFTLAASQLLTRAGAWTITAVVVAATLVLSRGGRQLGTFAGGVARTYFPRRPSATVVIPLAVLAVVFSALFVLAMRPVPEWDADTYHLTVPRLYIEHGGFRHIRFNVYSNWPMNVEMLYTLGMLLGDYLLASTIHVAFAVLTVAALFRFFVIRGEAWAGAVASALYLANEVVLVEAGIAYVDVAFGFFFLMAMLFLIEAERSGEHRRRHLVLCGVSCGLMAGVKLTGLFALPSVAIVMAIDGWQARRLPRAAREFARFVMLPCFALVAPWYVKSAWYTGNPVYPVLYGVFGGIEWNAALSDQLFAWQHAMGMGRSLADYLLLPIRVVLSAGHTYDRFGESAGHFWIVVLPAVAVVAAFDADVRRLVLAAAAYFVCWASSSQQMRFLIPAIAVLAAAGGLGLARAADWWPRLTRVLRPAMIAGAAGLYLVVAARPVLAEAPQVIALYRQHGRHTPGAAVPMLYRRMNDTLPQRARVLFVDHNRGFFMHREYVADSFFEASQIRALMFDRAQNATELHKLLTHDGFTHILFGRFPQPYGGAFDELLGSRHVKPLFRLPEGEELYELRQEDAITAPGGPAPTPAR